MRKQLEQRSTAQSFGLRAREAGIIMLTNVMYESAAAVVRSLALNFHCERITVGAINCGGRVEGGGCVRACSRAGACVCVCVRARVWVYTCVCVHACARVGVYKCVCVCVAVVVVFLQRLLKEKSKVFKYAK